uniref:Arf-GAP with coiled-coil, ANK repeat and PH domain-containing protein n=1 Tax=Petromyzon marinus TaxID=7757 RepID=A0AAJ7X2V4_PETMA|nr:arf-GAP with coiled-coil, ANK repeat and PH domain-containing protein 3-like isoform X1 [Petromyzon marinus]
MVVTVDFDECLKDSPRFRASLEEVEGDVVELEVKLEKLVKLCGGMIEAGKAYNVANRLFVNGLRDLVTQSRKDDMLVECLDKFASGLQEVVKFYTVLFDQAHRSIKLQLQKFVKEDVKKLKETKKHFEKMSEDMEGALARNAQVSRTRPHEMEEASAALASTRKCFRHLALDYALQINVLQTKKRLEVLDSMLSYMHAQYAFFQQGFDLLNNLDPYMKNLASQLDQLVVESAVEKREMEHKHALIQQKATIQEISDDGRMDVSLDSPTGVVMEGYLYKRASNAFKTWNRRWFSIQNNQLVYQKKMKDGLTVVVEDLRLCSVKPHEDIERRFCFEVVSPNKSCILQADSEKLRQLWIQAVQASIATAYRDACDDTYAMRLERNASPSTGSLDSASDARDRGARGCSDNVLARVQAIRGNERCCDCGQPDPRWASINLGIALCIECSGIHRSLGVHCSKVRSLTLDSWEPELLKLMCELGNHVINDIYEASADDVGGKKPTPSSSRQEKEMWIRAKYVDRKFLRPFPEAARLAQESGALWAPRPVGPALRPGSSRAPSSTGGINANIGGGGGRGGNTGIGGGGGGGGGGTMGSGGSRRSGSASGSQRGLRVSGGSGRRRRRRSSGGGGGGASNGPGPAGVPPGGGGGGGRRETGTSLSSPRLHPAVAALEKQFRRDSLFCPDELDSLFSYFDNAAAGGGARKPSQSPVSHHGEEIEGRSHVVCVARAAAAGLSSDSGLGGSSDGSTDILVFDSVPEQASECSDDSSLEEEEADEEEVGGFRQDGGESSSVASTTGIGNKAAAAATATAAASSSSSATMLLMSAAMRSLALRGPPVEATPAWLLRRAALARCLPIMAEALAHGADVNRPSELGERDDDDDEERDEGEEDDEEGNNGGGGRGASADNEGRTPLVYAVYGGSLVACEFLLQNGADVNLRDARDRSPLHHATQLGYTGQVCLFLKRGANQNAVDEGGMDPLSIAVQAANADIVTLLRLARMNEEMRESEGFYSHPGHYPSSSPTEQQYRKCIQEFIALQIDDG